MKNEDLQKYANAVSSSITKDLKVISSIVYKYDIRKILDDIKDVPRKNRDDILELCINNCLEKIKKYSFSTEQYRKIDLDVEELVDFYSEDKLEEIIEEASNVTYDLIMKVTGYNKRSINLPIQINFIKTFCINNMIQNKDIDTTILYIVLYLSMVCYCLENNNYKVVSSN